MASFASTEAVWTNKIIQGSSNNTQGTRVGSGFLDRTLKGKGRKEFPAKWMESQKTKQKNMVVVGGCSDLLRALKVDKRRKFLCAPICLVYHHHRQE